jgi:hypothetical protein
VQLLYAVTNAFKYIRIGTDERVWWGCASDADLLLHKLYNFTKLTRKGRPVFHDRFVEYVVGDIRTFLGHGFHEGKEAEISRVYRCLDELIRNRHRGGISILEAGSEGRIDTTTVEELGIRHVAISNVYKGMMQILEKTNVWGAGGLRDKSGRALEGFTNFENVPLNVNAINLMHSAETRLKEYADLYYLNPNLVSGSPRGSRFTMPSILKSEVQASREQDRKRQTTTIQAEIMSNLFTCASIQEELAEMRTLYANLGIPPNTSLRSARKEELARLLSIARRHHHAQVGIPAETMYTDSAPHHGSYMHRLVSFS